MTFKSLFALMSAVALFVGISSADDGVKTAPIQKQSIQKQDVKQDNKQDAKQNVKQDEIVVQRSKTRKYGPNWKVGDSWGVNVTTNQIQGVEKKKGKPKKWNFKVEKGPGKVNICSVKKTH